MLYEPSLGQELNAVAIGASIERDGKVELGGVDSDSGAGDRYPFRVARELKLGCRRPETLKRQIAVAQDVDFAVLDASVHPAGHLENLDRKSTRLNSSHTVISTLSLHDALPISIERDGKVELGGVDSDSGAGDRYPFRVARELKLGCRRPETLKRQIAVAQDVDFAVLDASVHPAGHLENLVRPEVGPCQHVLAALHDVRVPRIVDHNGIQPPDIEGGLARGSHRQQKRSFDQTVKKRSNDADWLATVVERRGEVGPAVTKLLRDLLHLSPRGNEDGNASTLPHHSLYEPIVQKLEGLLRENIYLSRLGGIKRPGF